jgi:hypothetical protein
MEKRKISCPFQESNSSHPARSLSLYQLSNPGSHYYKYTTQITKRKQNSLHFNMRHETIHLCAVSGPSKLNQVDPFENFHRFEK